MSRASDRAYETIRTRILSGDLPPGAQLVEEALAELCGVSRTPVRDALRRLEAELLVERSDTQRSFVSDWSLHDVADAFMRLERLGDDELPCVPAKRAAVRTWFVDWTTELRRSMG